MTSGTSPSAREPLLERIASALAGLYEVEGELGRGGMAVVYRALDLRLRRRVAIKVLPPELAFDAGIRARFQREAQMAAQLSHPNIVPIHAVDERDGIAYFVMALVDGESLGAVLARGDIPPVEVVRRVLCDVADALAYAHGRGVVHRDVKPDNILLERETGRPMVTDFGIARATEGGTRLTVTGMAVGTPTYMSPEQAAGDRELDGRSDIYSLAVVGYQMLAGRPPFDATNTMALLMKHVSEVPRPLSDFRDDIPEELAGAIEQALRKTPDERWVDAAAFRDAMIGTLRAGGGRRTGVTAPGRRATGVDQRPSTADRQRGRWAAPWGTWSWRGADETSREDREVARRDRTTPGTRRPARKAKKMDSLEKFAALPLEQRIRKFRLTALSNVGWIAALATINLMTSPQFWWFLFPAMFMMVEVLSKLGSLWSDGVPIRRILGFDPNGEQSPEQSRRTAVVKQLPREIAKLVPRDVLDGPLGALVHRAATDRAAIATIVAQLSPADRERLPEVDATAQSLLERVASLAPLVHSLDGSLDNEALAKLDARLTDLRRQPSPGADSARRLALLERQRATLDELMERRAALMGQLDSALLSLENVKFDLVKLRSGGLEAGLTDVQHATREARALSAEIGRILEAVAEVRPL